MMTNNPFDQYLPLINREIQEYLLHLMGRFHTVLGVSEGDLSYDVARSMMDPVEDMVRRGGKRWRAVLLLLAEELMKGGDPLILEMRSLPLVSLVEIVHGGTLIIDDIEDSSDLRRGEMAIHLRYGEDVAINSGNLSYFLPLEILERGRFSDAEKLELFCMYSRYLRGLHGGQGMDICWHRDLSIVPGVEEYLTMCSLKTGTLAGMAMEMGAFLGGALKEDRRVLGNLARTLGVIFQIQDDIINITTGNPGKQRGDDILEGKKSLPLIMALRAYPREKETVLDLMSRIRRCEATERSIPVEEVVQWIHRREGVEMARQRVKGMLDQVNLDARTILNDSGYGRFCSFMDVLISI